MKGLERSTAYNLLNVARVCVSQYFNEKTISPNADMTGPLIGAFSHGVVSPIVSQYINRGKALNDQNAPDFFVCTVLGLGIGFVAAKVAGKSWKDWTGDFMLVSGTMIAQRVAWENRSANEDLNIAIRRTIGLATLIGFIALRKRRNPSLGVKPYLIHALGLTVLLGAWEGFLNRKNVKGTKKHYLLSASIGLTTLFTAYVMQKVVGEKAFRFNYKAQMFSTLASLGLFFLFHDTKSPIYEKE